MFSHITVGTRDLDRAIAFYDAALGPLGIRMLARRHNPERALYAAADAPDGALFSVFTPINGEPATAGNGVTVGFEATSRAQVDAFYAHAISRGATDEGPPGLRLHYSPNYYGTYVRDLDGNKLCCVCHRAA